jgi:hypothetical protein
MAYLLEDVTQNDFSKIISDCRTNEDIIWQIEYAIKDGSISKKWAINKETGSYLILLPDLVKDPFILSKFMFYFGNEIHNFIFNGTFENSIETTLNNKLNDENRNLLQDSITEAFSVYGRYGDGLFDRHGRPENKVFINFNKECK